MCEEVLTAYVKEVLTACIKKGGYVRGVLFKEGYIGGGKGGV